MATEDRVEDRYWDRAGQHPDLAADEVPEMARTHRNVSALTDALVRVTTERDQARDLAASAAEEAMRLREVLTLMAGAGWSFAPGRLPLDDDPEEGPTTGPEGFGIFDEDADEYLTWTPHKGGAEFLVARHNELVDAAKAALAGAVPAEEASDGR